MAVLIQDEAQVKACEEINGLLSVVYALNDLIKTEEPLAIQSRKRRVEVDAEYEDKLRAAMKSMRQKRIKEIHSKAAKFRIALSDEEKAALSDSAIF